MIDEEEIRHPFVSRTPYEPGDERDIWCKDCEYHRDHQIHAVHPKLIWVNEYGVEQP
jgi:hypothetical protein